MKNIIMAITLVGAFILGYFAKKEVVQMCKGQTCDKVLDDSTKCMDQLDRCREECVH